MKKNQPLTTEAVNPHTARLGQAAPAQLVRLIHRSDAEAARAVGQAAPALARVIKQAAEVYLQGHKIIFIGAGTSGRLGVLEAAECVPTFSTKPSQIIGLIAGGKKAMFRSQEGAEDKAAQGAADIKKHIAAEDFVIGLTASGRTPYVLGALQAAKRAAAHTALLACNANADTTHADIFIYLPTGPEVLSGSTRMKAGTATKMALNIITTGAMARAGKIYQNLMVDVQPTNQKLVRRAVGLIERISGADEKTARRLLTASGNRVKTAVVMHLKKCSRAAAEKRLKKCNGFLQEALRAD